MKKFIKLRVVLTIMTGVLLAPAIVFAVVQSLNGATGNTQTFVNDSNVTITTNTSANTHTFGWNGLLSAVRGGTGANLSLFTSGSILFWDGSGVAENNAALFWDNANEELFINNNFNIRSGGLFMADGAVISFGGIDNTTLTHSDNGLILNHKFQANEFLAMENGTLIFNEGGANQMGFTHQGANLIAIDNGSLEANLDISLLDTSRTFTFPNASGTFGLLEANQIFSGLNKFESTASSSIYIGSPTKSGCIVMGDSDGSGMTYITANDGVLTASSSKPSICQ